MNVNLCPKCSSPLGEIVETSSGRKLQRCTKGVWNKDTRQTEGCTYVKWLVVEPKKLNEKCPKCGSFLLLQFTRFGKKMKKCEKGKWDSVTKKVVGCDYIEWINGTTQKTDEKCPQCGKQLIIFTTNKGKSVKKCSTSGWDKVAKKATGCTYIEWLKGNYSKPVPGEELLPQE